MEIFSLFRDVHTNKKCRLTEKIALKNIYMKNNIK